MTTVSQLLIADGLHFEYGYIMRSSALSFSTTWSALISSVFNFNDIIQDAEYINTAEEAWKEAVEIAKSSEGWKEEKFDKKSVGGDYCRDLPNMTLTLAGRHRGESQERKGKEDLQVQGQDRDAGQALDRGHEWHWQGLRVEQDPDRGQGVEGPQWQLCHLLPGELWVRGPGYLHYIYHGNLVTINNPNIWLKPFSSHSLDAEVSRKWLQ